MARADASVNQGLPAQVERWRDRLEGVAPLDLPADRPRPVIRSTSTAAYECELPGSAAAALAGLAAGAAATPSAVLAAAFAAVLTRYSGQEDIALGTVSPRTGHTVVLRTGVDAAAPFEALLRDTVRSEREALADDGLPFADLVEALAPQPDTSTTPFTRAMVTLCDELTPEQREFDPLDLSVEVSAAELRVRVRYSTALFDEATAARLAGHLTVLLTGAGADPSRPLSALAMLTDAEFEQVVREWNDTAREVPTATFPELFAAQAAARPDATAVIDEQGPVSYRELDERANRIAHRLLELGAGRDQLIGLCVERGAAMAAGLLGIMKAGAAYLPLDPGYPADRLAYMLEDSGARIVVTQRELRDRLPATDAALLDLTTSRRRTASLVGPVLAIVAIVGVFTTVMSTTGAATEADDRARTAAQLVVEPAGGDGLTDGELAVLRADKRVAAVSAPAPVDVAVAGPHSVWKDQAAVADPVALARAHRITVNEGAVGPLQAGQVAISKEFADWYGHHAGSEITYGLFGGEPVTARVTAVLDGGSAVPHLLLPADVRDAAARPERAHVVLDAASADSAGKAAAELAERLGGDRVKVTPTDLWFEHAATDQDRLNQLVLLVLTGPASLYALIAVASTLVMSYSRRGREIAGMRMVGVSTGQLRRMALWETLGTTLAGVAIAAAVVALGARAYRGALTVFGGEAPLSVPWGLLGSLAGACLLVGVVVSLSAVGRLVRRGGVAAITSRQ